MDNFPLIAKAKLAGEGLQAKIDAAYTYLKCEANEIAHGLAFQARGREYMDEVLNDSSKKYTVFPEEADQEVSTSSPEAKLPLRLAEAMPQVHTTKTGHGNIESTTQTVSPAVPEKPLVDATISPDTSRQPLPTIQAITADATISEQRRNDFDTDSAKARSKARALAELKMEEMELREREVRMKIEKLEAKRALLELDGE